MNVKFKQWDCEVHFAMYGNKRTAIKLMNAEEGPIATASVNLPDEPMADNEIGIKDYSENEGMLEVLMEAGIVSKPDRYVASGWVHIPICKLLVEVPR